jgi:hypothetical protein
MRKLLVSAAAAALLAVGAGAAFGSAAPGSDPYGTYGLCNAYGQGSETGQAQKQAHGQAFIRLINAAGDYNHDGKQDSSDVQAYCADNFPKPGK